MLSDILNAVYVGFVVLVLFNLTIFIHELGHFLVGRWRGAKIERFAIWFGPAIWSRTYNGVEYRLGCIPLGGYVAFPQLAMEEIEGKSQTPVEELPPLKPKDKIPILLAGSFSNILLSFVVAAILWVVGIPKDASSTDLTIDYIPEKSPERLAGILPGDKIISINGERMQDWKDVIQSIIVSQSAVIRMELENKSGRHTVEFTPSRDPNMENVRLLNIDHANVPIARTPLPNSPGEKAGIQSGDEFLEMDGQPIQGVKHMLDLVKARGNKPTHLVLLRGKERIEKDLVPLYEKTTQEPRMGVPLDYRYKNQLTTTVYPNPWEQVMDSLKMIAVTFKALFYHNVTGVGLKHLSGPVGIVEILYNQISDDMRLALKFLVMLNINLAVINLLPIPVLDGGHIVFSIIEAIRKKSLSLKFMERLQTVFVVLLLTFMLYVSFYDVKRSSSRGLLSKVLNVFSAKQVQPPFEEMPAKKN